MANDPAPTAEDIGTAKPAPAGDDDGVKITIGRLAEESGAFLGIERHVFAGAFAGADPKKEVTLKAAKDRCAKWLKAPDSTTVSEEE